MNRYIRYAVLGFMAIGVAACSSRAGEISSKNGKPNASYQPKELSAAASSGDRSMGAVDPSIYGVWIPETYMYNGKAYKIDDGLMIITPTYLIANAIYDLSEKKKPKPDANANYGTYWIKAPGQLVMSQAMQLHWRSEDAGDTLAEGDGTFFKQDVLEEIHYEVKNDTLIFRFQIPGEQSWIMKRVSGETCAPPAGDH